MGAETVRAVRGVSLDVADGDYVAIVGPSGCGKSTMLNLLGVIDQPTAGTIAIRGRDRNIPIPFGPYLVPGLSILACLYIMKDLSATTFRVFFIWMTVAVLTYFGYSIRHSRLERAEAERQEVTS